MQHEFTDPVAAYQEVQADGILFEGPLYLFFKSASRISNCNFRASRKNRQTAQVYVHRKKQAIMFHVKMQILFMFRKT